jgi:cytochrome c553
MLKRSLLPHTAAVLAAIGISVFAVVPASAQDNVALKAQACGACHGQSGTPIAATFPIIWGQQSNYLYKELHDFHSGERKNPIMAPLIEGTSLDDLRALANYFAAKPWPDKHADAGAPASPAAPPEAIAAKIQMCKACHQANFEGGAPAPRLAGLSYEYLRSAMNAFADGARTNNLDMPGFMKGLTESERDAMAKYLAGL